MRLGTCPAFEASYLHRVREQGGSQATATSSKSEADVRRLSGRLDRAVTSGMRGYPAVYLTRGQWVVTVPIRHPIGAHSVLGSDDIVAESSTGIAFRAYGYDTCNAFVVRGSDVSRR